jgi:mRNA interferase MazF
MYQLRLCVCQAWQHWVTSMRSSNLKYSLQYGHCPRFGIVLRMMSRPSSSKTDIILVHYPFLDLSSSKVRPAVVMSSPHVSQDIIITPLTSKTASLLESEFVLSEWSAAGLNVATAIKRGLYTVQESLVIRAISKVGDADTRQLGQSLQG